MVKSEFKEDNYDVLLKLFVDLSEICISEKIDAEYIINELTLIEKDETKEDYMDSDNTYEFFAKVYSRDKENFVKVLDLLLNLPDKQIVSRKYYTKRIIIIKEYNALFLNIVPEYNKGRWIIPSNKYVKENTLKESEDKMFIDDTFVRNDIIFNFTKKKLEIGIWKGERAIHISHQINIEEKNLKKKTPSTIKLLYAILKINQKNKPISSNYSDYERYIEEFIRKTGRTSRKEFDVDSYITNLRTLFEKSASGYEINLLKNNNSKNREHFYEIKKYE